MQVSSVTPHAVAPSGGATPSGSVPPQDTGLASGVDPVSLPTKRPQPRLPTTGLAAPKPGSPAPPAVMGRAVKALEGNATIILRPLSGHAWDLALVGVLELQWRGMTADLAKLTVAETDRLAAEVVRRLTAQRCLRPGDAESARLASYAVRMVVDRAREAGKTEKPPQRSANAPTSIAKADDSVILDDSATIAKLRTLIPSANVTHEERERLAQQAKVIVDRKIRDMIAHDPQHLQHFVSQLSRLSLQIANLPVDFRDGWSVAVADGHLEGTIKADEPYDAPRIWGQRFRFGLHDLKTGKRDWGPRPVDVVYTFADAIRYVDAAAYARTLIAQDAFVHRPGWPKGLSPYQLSAVRQYFQSLITAGTPMPEVFSTWQTYLSAFYIHANSADLQGHLGGKGLGLYATKRLSDDMQAVVDDLLPANTGQRLLDCEFFAALTRHVFSGLKQADGSPRFDTYWIALDTHEAAVVVERGSGPHAWAFMNNNEVGASGTTTGGLDQEIIDKIGRNIFWGAPAIFGIGREHDQADRAQRTIIGVPSTNAYVYDGKTVSRVTAADQRAFYIYVATRKDPFDTRDRDFVASWRQ